MLLGGKSMVWCIGSTNTKAGNLIEAKSFAELPSYSCLPKLVIPDMQLFNLALSGS